jgi:hypothetical protein
MLTRLSLLVLLGLALVLVPLQSRAQSQPCAAQLQRMVEDALGDQETVTFARPEPLGFTERVVTHQLSLVRGGVEYFFAVTKPRLRDGLVFFTHQPARRLYVMHRTDTHLRRVASARNDLSRGDAGLVPWSGPEADADFANQLAIWAANYR